MLKNCSKHSIIKKNAEKFGNEYLFTYLCIVKLKDDEKQNSIIEATLNLIFTRGLVGLKMSVIAKEAKIAVGTLYIYFDSKEQLLNDIFMRFKRASMEALQQEIDDKLPFKENFKLVWQRYLEFALENPREATLLEQLHQSPYLQESVKAEAETLLMPIKKLLDKGKQLDEIKEIDNEILMAFLSGSINQLARKFYEKQINATPNNIEEIFLMAWHSVKKEF